MNEQSLFIEALEKENPAERATFLDRACAGVVGLRERIERLLARHARQGSGPEEAALVATIDSPAAERPGSVIGPYKLMEQIGEGGMGLVFVAEQREPVRRKVALKVIKPGMDTRAVIARFGAERQALALMDHPNIARVLDGGETESGRPYFVMELVRGAPITEYCDQNRLPTRERLELFLHVCRAVQHAHQKGVIHRDLKPSNVLVASHDGTPVVKVIDFGVAKAVGQQLTDKTVYTQFAQLVGTPLYMSPEQAGQSSLDVDTRTDVYALGVLLYEFLTGTTPFDKDRLSRVGYDELRRIIREEEPPRPSARISTLGPAAATVSACRGSEPRKLSALVRGELDWIVMKAMEKDRTRRYDSASAFALDVQRYLADEPVQACPPSTWYRFGKFAKRNRREVLIAGATAAVAVAGVAGLAVSRALIARALKSETRAKENLRVEVYFQRITVAHRELSIDNLAAALRALQDCPEDLRGWEWHYLMRLFKFEPQVLRDSTEVYGVAFSPDGERIASAGKDGRVKIWNGRTGRVLPDLLAHDGAARCAAFHPDGRHVASAGADRLVKVWDLETRQQVFQGECDAVRPFGAAYTVAFCPPHGRLLAAGCDRVVRVWDWRKNQSQDPRHAVSGPEYHSTPVAFSRDGRRLASPGTWEEGLKLSDAETGEHLDSLPAPRHPISALAFSPDGGRLASANFGRSVNLWDTTTHELQTLPHDGNVLGVAFSPDGQRLASVGEDKTVHIWDPATGRAVLGLHGHAEMCGCVAFSPDGHRLVSASHDGTIRIWDATPVRAGEGRETLTFPQRDEVRSVAVSPDGRWVVSAGNGTLVRVWDAATARESFTFPGHSAPVFAAAWHPDPGSRRIATSGSVGREHGVKVWDASNGEVYFEIPVGRGISAGPYQVVAFSPDGRFLVTGQLEGAVQLWDARTGQMVPVLNARTDQKSDNTFATHDREIRGVVFSRDGRYLATSCGDGKVKLWDATRLKEKQEPRWILRTRVPGPSVSVAFSPDGQQLATGGEGNTVRIWDMQTGREVRPPLRGHSKEVYAVAFSPAVECPWIGSGGEDGKVKVWDSRSGELVSTLHGHTGIVSSLAFSPDGKRLYSGSRDKTVKLWDLTEPSQVADR